MLERIKAGFAGAGWEMIPMPSLLALPSRPMAIIVEVLIRSEGSFGGNLILTADKADD